MTTRLTIKTVPVDSLTPDPLNARRHGARNLDAIKNSLDRFGQRRPLVVTEDLVVVAGNGTLEAAKSLGWDRIAVTVYPGTEEEARAYSIADNRTAELAEWDRTMLLSTIEDLSAELRPFTGFTLEEAEEETKPEGDEKAEKVSKYTAAVNVPQYQPTGERPATTSLLDRTRTRSLQNRIQATPGLPDDVREFLLYAAERHTVFDYRLIAEFYAQADAQTQQLMEDSALVIIDVEDAIRLGYVKMMDALTQMRLEDSGE